MKTLIIVDLQKDFYDPKGSLSVSGADVFPSKIAALVPDYDNVYMTLDWHPLNHCSFKQNGGIWPVHCLKYSWGASLPDEVLNALDITKQHVSYYHKGDRSYEEEYEAYKDITDNQLKFLRDSDAIDICGLCGDYCVGLTIKRLIELGLRDKITVIKGCTGSIDDGSTLEGIIKDNNLKTK
ncbi:MAG: isochorismatase family protein [Bacteroidia bacterium]|nr:isochorismatase family protein [Bacteroidia bacterium]